jgi:hypothetical protein
VSRLIKILLTGPDLAKNLNSLTLLTSCFTMKSGDKKVAGVSELDGGDKGLILIITGKIVR